MNTKTTTPDKRATADDDVPKWSGWTGLAAAILEQAVTDTRNLIKCGWIKEAVVSERVGKEMAPNGNDFRRRRCVMIDRRDAVVNLIEFWLGGPADALVHAAGFRIDLARFKAEIRAAGRTAL